MIAPHCFSHSNPQSFDQQDQRIGDGLLFALRRQSLKMKACGSNEENDRASSFPQKLFQMLALANKESFEDLVSWEPNGKCFVVRQAQKFAQDIMPRFLGLNKVSAFKAMLRKYGFSSAKAYQGEAMAFQHDLFCRDHPEMISHLMSVSSALNNKGVSSKIPPITSPKMSMQTEIATMTFEVAPSDVTTTSSERDSDQESDLTEEEEVDEELLETTTINSSGPTDDAVYQEMLCNFAMDLDGLTTTPHQQMPSPVLDPVPPQTLSQSPASVKISNISTLDKDQAIGSTNATTGANKTTRPIQSMGPLRTPGRLRNAFGVGIKATCYHAVPKGCATSKGRVVKEILMDFTDRNASERAEWERFQKPLMLNPISSEMSHNQYHPTKATTTPDVAISALSDLE